MNIHRVGVGGAILTALVLIWIWSGPSSRIDSADLLAQSSLDPSGHSEWLAEASGARDPTVDLRETDSDRVKTRFDEGPEEGHDHARGEDPTGDLALYERLPMSSIPHRVVRGWGARGAGEVAGVVGAFVIVDPGLSDDELAELARDVREYHYDATALSVRILDSQVAATYDRHTDGGKLAAAHLLGFVSKNTHLGIDRIEIRGKRVD